MKNKVTVFDLGAPDVEISKEDSEVFALVNRGKSSDIEDRLLVKDGNIMYITTKAIFRNDKENELVGAML